MCYNFYQNLYPLRYDLNNNINKKLQSQSVLKNSNAIVDLQKMHILRGVIAIFRHSDRTAKQKYKCRTHNSVVIDMIKNTKKHKLKWVFRKSPKKVEDFAKIARKLYDDTGKEKWAKMEEIILRKNMSTKIQIKACEYDKHGNILLAECILKWGGILTPAGILQCQKYAPLFRNRAIKTTKDKQALFMKKMKVYHTEEYRVRKTAREFTRTCLDTRYIPDNTLKEDQRMLDNTEPVKKMFEDSKHVIKKIFYNKIYRDSVMDPNFVGPNSDKKKKKHKNCVDINVNNDNNSDNSDDIDDNKLTPWAQRLMIMLGNPIEKLHKLYDILLKLQKILNYECSINPNKKLYINEKAIHMKQRWDKIIDELYDNNKNKFDCTKIPDVFDSCRYDLLHNKHILMNNNKYSINLDEFWKLTELLAGFVIPQEYGVNKNMKYNIGRTLCHDLFKDIKNKIKHFKMDYQA